MDKSNFKHIDWVLLLIIVPILAAGLVTMKSFSAHTAFFNQQIIWIILGITAFFVISFLDLRFLKKTSILVFLYSLFVLLLVSLLLFGSATKGAERWFNLGLFSFQPVDFMKIIMILVLAKYFSRRHVEINNIKHIFISAIYVAVPFVLVFLQPDFGSAIIIFLIWLVMTMVSGISKKNLIIVFGFGVLALFLLWTFVLKPYQKARVETFLNPLSDIQNTGYNAYQSVVAVGSGQIFGKGVGYGTQSRLKFLPEYETDFVFAAFSEEWGFIGSIAILILYLLLVWRIIWISMYGRTNFEILFGVGVAVMLMSHVLVNIGMNIGLMPVTGLNLPFMSYGGSHLLVSFVSLGILSSMNRNRRSIHRDDANYEFLGV